MQESHRGGAFPHEASAELCSFPQFQDPDALGLKANQPREASGIQVLFFHFQNQHKLHQFEIASTKIAIQTRSIFTFCAYWSPKGRWSNKPYDSQPKRNQIVARDP